MFAQDNTRALRQSINAFKLLRYTTPSASLSADSETTTVKLYVAAYFDALKLGKDLADTELQPADDLAVLAGQALVSLWKLVGGPEGLNYLYNAVALLEYALSKSKEAYQFKVLLIRIYHMIGRARFFPNAGV